MSFDHEDDRDQAASLTDRVLLGYQTTRLAAEPSISVLKRLALVEFARQHGFRLGRIFDDNDVNRPCAALVSLIAEARATQVTAVAVPTAEDLGLVPHVQRLTQERIERETGVRVLITDPILLAGGQAETDPGHPMVAIARVAEASGG